MRWKLREMKVEVKNLSKIFYCSNCGLRLQVYRKAMPKYGRILELVSPHKCTKEPIEFDLSPLDMPLPTMEEKDNKFVKKLNELSPPPSLIPKLDLRDRRPPDQVKSSAPESLLTHMKNVLPTTPANDISNEPE